jgi:glycerate kinase
MPQDRKRPSISDKRPLHASLRVLIAPDKFKGTLSSDEAAKAIEKGLRRAWPEVKTTRFTLTDGGEGFLEWMVRQTGGRLRVSRTIDAAGRPCRAKWGVMGNGRTAVIGLTCASGIAQLPPNLRNPERTTNGGTAILLSIALAEGFDEILVGLGGSATTEGGVSLASGITHNFYDKDWNITSGCGLGLGKINRIESTGRKIKSKIIVATDVNNPLFGLKGAAYQFAPQKGADAAMVKRLDAGLRRLARIVKRDLGRDLAHEPGAGAAGGCGYGLMTFFNAKRENGFQLVRRWGKLDALVRRHDLVITGEGCFDRTSLLGKAPSQLGDLARKLKRPIWLLCGRVDLTPRQLSRSPFDRIAALNPVGLRTRKIPGPPLDSLTPAQHAKRLEQLAYEAASTLPFPGR